MSRELSEPLDSLEALEPLAPDNSRAPIVPIVVIGAGIVGVSIAHRLRMRGHEVLVLERSAVAAQASRGNAGGFAFSDILPLASPGILKQVPRWLLDPLGPLALRPAYLPAILPWLWRFLKASRPEAFAGSLRAQAAMMQLAEPATGRLLEAAGAISQLRSAGNLHLYESRARWEASLPGWALREAHGVTVEHLHGRDAIARYQPGLDAGLVAASFVPGWKNIDDPLVLVRTIAASFEAKGGQIRRADVRGLEPGTESIGVMLDGGYRIAAGRVVVAAGAWSHRIAASIGDRIPLETERGYNTTLPPGAFALESQLSFPDHGFVVSPIAGGVRVGGAVELGGLVAPPSWRRADALLAKAKRFMPTLDTKEGVQWMGFRPSLPDSLPVVGVAPADSRVLYAFGHGHLGLTQAAATAELVADLVDGEAPGIDLSPFDPKRFRS